MGEAAQGDGLAGKRALVMGVANDRSIAWGIAQSLAAHGAELALSFLPDELGRAERRVRKLADSVGGALVLPCDVKKDEDIERLFASLGERWGSLDVLVHCLAWARLEDLTRNFSAVTREGFALAHEVSVYSLIAAARAARPWLKSGGSLLTLTYLGATHVVPGYNVMGVAKAALESTVRYLAAELGPEGIRVNAISAGPVETLAASAIPGFSGLLTTAATISPLRRNVTTREIGEAAAFLCSPAASGITGQVLFVDAGFHVVSAACGLPEGKTS
jgi:enoyl-[acyl-carrier protein] reductase I